MFELLAAEWQSYVFLCGSFVMAALLLPMVLDAETVVPLKTSIPTAFVLYVYAATFSTMGYYPSMLGAFLTASGWTFIAVFRRPDS